ncbi:DUF6069 family protein [Streptomyces sp. NPDC002680]|uniref:DUF6069 family protein n=1 Tax=Streptomyces sp. NPDC002680 TaxID=3364659 RepID=UPI0036B12787
MVAGGLVAAFILSSLVNALIAVVAHQLGAPEDFDALKPPAYATLTALGVLAGAAGWALVRRFSKNPERLLRKLVPTVLVLSFPPDFAQLEEEGVIGVVALLLMHVAVTVIAVPAYLRVMPLK